MEQNLLPWKTTESTVTPEWVASLLFISKMVGRYLLVHWCQFCQIHGIEKEKTRAWRHEKGLQVWEGQMFFRPKEREKKEREPERKNEEWEKWSSKERFWRGEQGRKTTSTRHWQNPESLCVSSPWENKKSVRPLPEPYWHFTQTQSKWATKTSPPSPLIHCLFLLPLYTKGCAEEKGNIRKNKNYFFFCTRGLDYFYRNYFWKKTMTF